MPGSGSVSPQRLWLISSPGERSSALARPYRVAPVDTSRLSRSELVGVAAAVVLVLSLFLEWYSLGTHNVERPDDSYWVCGEGNNSCTAWDTFPILRWLLLAAAAAPLILSWIVIRGHELTWPRGEVTAIVGLIAL